MGQYLARRFLACLFIIFIFQLQQFFSLIFYDHHHQHQQHHQHRLFSYGDIFEWNNINHGCSNDDEHFFWSRQQLAHVPCDHFFHLLKYDCQDYYYYYLFVFVNNGNKKRTNKWLKGECASKRLHEEEEEVAALTVKYENLFKQTNEKSARVTAMIVVAIVLQPSFAVIKMD